MSFYGTNYTILGLHICTVFVNVTLQVVTLRTDVLLRSLGPMASLLQKSLSPVLKDTSQSPCDASRGASDLIHHAQSPSYPLPIPNMSNKAHPKGASQLYSLRSQYHYYTYRKTHHDRFRDCRAVIAATV